LGHEGTKGSENTKKNRVCSVFAFSIPFVVSCLVLSWPIFSWPLIAINLALTQADVERALVIARADERERARFHAPYLVAVNDPFVQSLEVITEFRRVVLIAEDRIRRGDRAFAYSSQTVQKAAATWKDRVSIVARLRFHPHHAYVNVPPIEITVDGPNADAALIGVLKEPLIGFSGSPGEAGPMIGAVAEGVFYAKLIGQTRRNVTVRLDGKTLVTRPLDFAAIE
jgi:hypothetical protein